jgi:glycosyltransferase involved in cell wall biosynthesis
VLDRSAYEETMRRAAPLGDRVRYWGYQPDPWRVAPVDVLLHTSSYEGLSRVLLEGMSAGAAIVATNVGGAHEAIVDGRSGYLAPAGDAEELAERLAALAASADARAEVGGAAAARWAAEFRIETMVDRLSAVYDRVAA